MAFAPHLFVIFGASGDLTRRKLMPALYRLMERRGATDKIHILGVALTEWTDEDFRREMAQSLAEHGFGDETCQGWCQQRLYYQRVDGSQGSFEALAKRVAEIEQQQDLPGNRAFYLALPPPAFAPTIRGLGEVGLAESEGWTRLIIEKPFGNDLASAQRLNELLHRHFSEEQVYRIDHYLGKETVQNLLVFRFANALFETVWNRDRVKRIEITVAEDLGVESRAGYYDRSGALRDMIQNHLTQLFSLIAMETPSRFDAEAIRREKIKLLECVRPIDPTQVLFGQYTEGEVGGERVPGYLDEPDIPDDSRTETFVQVTLNVENWRWQGVPFLLRTGKRLPRRKTEIIVHFDCAPVSIFQPFATTCVVSSNVLVITLQPNEGFDLYFEVKQPGDTFRLATQKLDFRYEDVFGREMPEAYETLLGDVVEGDQTLFVHAAEVEASWRLYTPLLQANLPVYSYPAGTEGPLTDRHPEAQHHTTTLLGAR